MANFKFIDSSYTGPDALSADELTAQDLGTLFFLQSKEIVFSIGNLSSSTANYLVQASGENQTLQSGVQFSLNGIDYGPFVTCSGVVANAISDPVRCKFTVPEESYITAGSFLIRVDVL